MSAFSKTAPIEVSEKAETGRKIMYTVKSEMPAPGNTMMGFKFNMVYYKELDKLLVEHLYSIEIEENLKEAINWFRSNRFYLRESFRAEIL